MTKSRSEGRGIKKIDLKSPQSTALKMLAAAQERAKRASLQIEHSVWAGAVQAAVESMERSAKGIAALTLHHMPKIHRLTPDYNIDCLKNLLIHMSKARSDADHQLFMDCAQALVWAYTWSSLHEINQWAFDDLPIITPELFNGKDAQTSLHYADRCAAILESLIQRLAS